VRETSLRDKNPIQHDGLPEGDQSPKETLPLLPLPWAKESLRHGALTVAPMWCQCSAGFHKRPFEVIFGQPIHAEVLQNVLQGDPVCRFAIYLPEKALEKARLSQESSDNNRTMTSYPAIPVIISTRNSILSERIEIDG